MRKVDTKAMTQPSSDTPCTAIAIARLSTCQTTSGIGRHCQIKRASAKALNKT